MDSPEEKEEASWQKAKEIFDKILIEIEETQRRNEAIEELHKALEEVDGL